MLPDEVVSVSSVGGFKRHLGFGVTGSCIIITKPTIDIYHWKSQCNNSIRKVYVVIRVHNRYYVGWKYIEAVRLASGYSLMMTMMMMNIEHTSINQTLA